MSNSFEFVKSSGGIEEYRLKSNDLTVLLMEDHSTPVVTFMVTYHVGSRYEAVGHTGATHLLEHLMFKGSEDFNKEKGNPIWVVLQNVGATVNASTWLDRTNYFELLPSEYLERSMAVEADRMRNAFLRDEDRQPEMTVVRNEFERGENEPFEVLDKNIWATAYQAHPYHHATIGWRSDIENVSTERLREFYHTFYWPNNATVTIIGDFDQEDALKKVHKHFGVISKSPHDIPQMYTIEPKQQGPRRVVVKRAGQTGLVGIAHKTPEGLHEDSYVLQVLSKILGSGKTSRFYRTIIDKGLATDVCIWDHLFHDNGLFITYVFLTPTTEHEVVEKIVLDEYEKVKKSGVSKEEVKRAVAKIRAETAFSRDGYFSIASNLNEAIAIGDWTFYTTFLDKIEKVTPEDVKRVAQKYLDEDQSTTGYFISEESVNVFSKGTGPEAVPSPLFWQDIPQNESRHLGDPSGVAEDPSGLSISMDVMDRKILDGVRLIFLKTAIQDVVTIRGSLFGGEVFSRFNNRAVAEMTAEMLDQGTTFRDKFAISDALEEVGASVSFACGKYRVRFDARCLSKDVPLVIDLVAEQLRHPAFGKRDLESTKKRRIGELKRMREQTRTRAMEAFIRKIYPDDHPNYTIPISKMIEDTENVTVSDLKEFHGMNYGVGDLTIVAVGDVNGRDLERATKGAFDGWQTSPLSVSAVRGSSAGRRKRGDSSVVTMKDKTSVDVVMGQPIGIDRNDAHYYPLKVGTFILGGNFSARLMATVRDVEGLTYGVYSNVGGVDNGNDGYWYVWGTFAPELVNRGRKSVMKQVRKWIEESVKAYELEAKKSTIVGSYKVGLSTTRGVADRILTIVERGWDICHIDEFPDKINAITLEDVKTAIEKCCDIKTLVTISAGSVDENGNPLED